MQILNLFVAPLPHRYLYWADTGPFPKLFKANLDGSGQTAIVTSGIRSPKALAVDHSSGDLYWADTIVDSIQV